MVGLVAGGAWAGCMAVFPLENNIETHGKLLLSVCIASCVAFTPVCVCDYLPFCAEWH